MGFDLGQFLGISKVATDAAAAVGKTTTDIITTARGELPPDAQVKIKELESSTEKAILDASVKINQSSKNFFIQYEGSATQIPKPILIFRALIRPVTTAFFLLVLMIWIGFQIFGRSFSLPKEFWILSWIVFGFWFGGRSFEKMKNIEKNLNS